MNASKRKVSCLYPSVPLVVGILLFGTRLFALAKCPETLQGTVEEPSFQTVQNLSTIQAMLVLQEFLQQRCGLPKSSPPVEFYVQTLPWKVGLNFQPLQIATVNEIEQSVTLSSYLILTWLDTSLSWDKNKYHGIDTVQIPIEYLWTPTIIMPKTTLTTDVSLQFPSTVTVSFDGIVFAPIATFVSTLCGLDMRLFPFDSHLCSIVFLEQEFFLNMTTLEANTSDIKKYFGTNAGWLIGEKTCVPHDSTSTQFPNFTYVVCDFLLTRRSAFYVVNLLGPMALTSTMTLIVFWIPLEEREKVSFVTSVFMSTSLYLGFLLDRLPRSMDTVPYINLLLLAIVAEVILATLATAVVLLRYNHTHHVQGTPENHNTEVQKGEYSEDVKNNDGVIAVLHSEQNQAFLTGICSEKNLNTEVSSHTVRLSSVSDQPSLNNKLDDQKHKWGTHDSHTKTPSRVRLQSFCCGGKCSTNEDDENFQEWQSKMKRLSYEERLRRFSGLPRVILSRQTTSCDTGSTEKVWRHRGSMSALGRTNHVSPESVAPSRLAFESSAANGQPPNTFSKTTSSEGKSSESVLGGSRTSSSSTRGDYSQTINVKEANRNDNSSTRWAKPRGQHAPDRKTGCGPTFWYRQVKLMSPKELDRAFFWIMFVVIVGTWLGFILVLVQ